MGYYTSLESTMKVTNRQEIPNGWEDFDGHGFYGCLEFDSIYVDCLEDRVKAYDIEDELQDLVDKLKLQDPDVEFVGYIEGHGEEHDDHWQLRVVDGRVVRYRGRIVYDVEERK